MKVYAIRSTKTGKFAGKKAGEWCTEESGGVRYFDKLKSARIRLSRMETAEDIQKAIDYYSTTLASPEYWERWYPGVLQDRIPKAKELLQGDMEALKLKLEKFYPKEIVEYDLVEVIK